MTTKNRYYVRLLNNDITAEDKQVRVTAISSANAKEVAETFNKQFKAEVAIRLDKQGESTESKLKDLAEAVRLAEMDGLEEVAMELRGEFNAEVAIVQKTMNVVAWGLAKKRIPELV